MTSKWSLEISLGEAAGDGLSQNAMCLESIDSHRDYKSS